MKLQAILFDVDGTLVDSNDVHARCWVEAFAHFGKAIEFDAVRSQIGKGGDLLVPDLLNGREMRRFGEDVKTYRSDLFKKKYMKTVKPFPRVKESLRNLAGMDVKIALASSSNPDEVDYYTQLLGLADLIEGSTSKKDATMSKPSPEIFEAALERAGTAPEFTLVVGDSPYDVLAAHRAALSIAAVLCGGFPREVLAKAEFLFDDVEAVVRDIETIDDYFSE